MARVPKNMKEAEQVRKMWESNASTWLQRIMYCMRFADKIECDGENFFIDVKSDMGDVFTDTHVLPPVLFCDANIFMNVTELINLEYYVKTKLENIEKERHRAKLKASALSKLTNEEKEALGVK